MLLFELCLRKVTCLVNELRTEKALFISPHTSFHLILALSQSGGKERPRPRDNEIERANPQSALAFIVAEGVA